MVLCASGINASEQSEVPEFYGTFSVSFLGYRQWRLRVLFKEMMKYVLEFFSGVLLVTSFVVATGARTCK